jgi:hypothetical protein
MSPEIKGACFFSSPEFGIINALTMQLGNSGVSGNNAARFPVAA